MNKNQCKITMLGTGNALVTHCYNTCFVLHTPTTRLLVDAGGGNSILGQLEKADISLGDIHDLFVTHSHTDHILGVIWVIRVFIQRHATGKFQGKLNVWSHAKVLNLLRYFCDNLLDHKQLLHMQECIVFHKLQDRDHFTVGDLQMQCFDILSTKEKQFGFTALLPDGQQLVCLGDEPYNEANHDLVTGADWMMCEAFCRHADRDLFKPYEKHHSTALDAAQLADSLKISNLILYHTEDKTLAQRKATYTTEANSVFQGAVYVTNNLAVIRL